MKRRKTARCETAKAKKIAGSSITTGGHCRCGEPLPDVSVKEKPYEFCSEKCKSLSEVCDVLKGKVVEVFAAYGMPIDAQEWAVNALQAAFGCGDRWQVSAEILAAKWDVVETKITELNCKNGVGR